MDSFAQAVALLQTLGDRAGEAHALAVIGNVHNSLGDTMAAIEHRERALAIYRKARPTYHPIAVATVDAIVGWKE